MTRKLSYEQLQRAVEMHCVATGKQFSEGEDTEGHRRFLISPGDIIVQLVDGKPVCEEIITYTAIAEILMEMPAGEEAITTKAPEKPSQIEAEVQHKSKVQGSPGSRQTEDRLARRPETRMERRTEATRYQGDSALAVVKRSQETEVGTYKVGSREIAAAKTNIAALMEAGGSLRIREKTHTADFIEYIVGASLGEQVVESSMSVYKQEYLAKKAWEWILKHVMDDPDLVAGVDEYGLPKFAPGKRIKVRMQDDMRNILVPLPAEVALWRELAREWQVAGRVCETKAYSRAADMLLRGEFRTQEEIADERAEVEATDG